MTRRVAAFAVAVLLLAAACWTVVPGPTLATLALAVAIPEVAPSALAIGLGLTLAVALLGRGRSGRAALAIALLADACFFVPLAQLPATRARTQSALSAAGIAPLRARPRAEVDVTRAIPVPLRDGGALAFDVYRPRTAGTLPLLVTVYGGAWSFGSRAEEAPLATWYAQRGYAVAVIDYRHAPTRRFPTQLHDVDDALRAVAAHAAALGLDRRRVALLGRSAGAELALLAAGEPQTLTVRACIAYYAPADLVAGWDDPPRPDPAGVRRILAAYLGGPPDAPHRTLYRAASPLVQAHRGMPPVLLIAGTRDELVRIGFERAYAARLHALDVPITFVELPWANHAFDAVDGLSTAIAHDASLRFLDELLAATPRAPAAHPRPY